MQKVTLFKNYPFDNSYSNTRLFSSTSEQLSYFNNLIYEVLDPVNFLYNNLLETTLEWVFEDDTKITGALNCNYIMVQGQNQEYPLFYFINSTRLNSGYEVTFELELDVLQTYLGYIDFDASLIERCHLDRFKPTVNNQGHLNYDLMMFDSDYKSPLFKTEPIKYEAKFPVYREKLKLPTDYHIAEDGITSGLSDVDYTLNLFINEYVTGWAKILVDNGGEGERREFYIGESDNPQPFTIEDVCINNTSLNAGEFVLPILKNGATILIEHILDGEVVKDYELNYNSCISKLLQSINPANVYDIQVSPLKPNFYLGVNVSYCAIESRIVNVVSYEHTLVIQLDINEYNNSNKNCNIKTWQYGARTHCALIIQGNDNSKDVLLTKHYPIYDLDFPIWQNLNPFRVISSFCVVDNNGNAKPLNPLLNPKLFNSQYCHLEITNLGKEKCEYGVLPLQPNFNRVVGEEFMQLSYIMDSIISPEMSNNYVRVKGSINSLYNEHTDKDLSTGIVTSEVFSLPFRMDKFQEYVANNKNYRINAYMSDFRQGVTGAMNNLFTNGVAAAGASLVGMGVSAMFTTFELSKQEDTLKHAPDARMNASNSYFLKSSYADVAPYAEMFIITEKEARELCDFNHQFGFTYSEIDKPNNYFHTRWFFNYIKFNPSNFSLLIDGEKKPIANHIKNRIKDIMHRGVRLWHTDEINYDLENPEISIFGELNNE